MQFLITQLDYPHAGLDLNFPGITRKLGQQVWGVNPCSLSQSEIDALDSFSISLDTV